MIPEVIARYRILSRLGAGGMGEVYLAEDPTLNRRVAIKVLLPASASDETARARLVREAQAAATIDHPNVCAIYEVGSHDGRDFFVMPYIEGLTIAERLGRGPLALDEALAIVEQVASALADAHAHGIIHRDIKPQNLMLDSRGQAKVMDFGLAKAESAGGDVDADTIAGLTEAGAIPGTTAYMSPEQLHGEPIDSRSDLFSLGCVFHEMIARRHPFKRESVAGTIAAILNDQPPELSGSAELERMSRKCLEKDRTRRYQTANDLLADLGNLRRDMTSTTRQVSAPPVRRRWIPAVVMVVAAVTIVGGWQLWRSQGSPAVSAIRSVAILPFDAAEPGTEYLGEGISENLINSLSQLPQLKVIARTTTFRYRGTTLDLPAMRRDLGVDAIVTGRVVQQGNALVVQADLTDAIDGTAIWGGRYNRQLRDVFAVQEEIAREIASNLRIQLTGREAAGLAKRYTNNIEAYRNYLLGRQAAQRRTVPELQKATAYYQQAIDQDPRYALAFAGLADAYTNLTARGSLSSADGRAKAQSAAKTALDLDSDLAEAHAAIGQTHVYSAPYDFASGDRALRRAIELSPSWAIGYQFLGLSLNEQGRLDEGIKAWEEARLLDPLSPIIGHLIAYGAFLQRDFPRSLDLQRQANRVGPPFSVHPEFEIYLLNGAAEEALAEIDKLLPGREGDPYLLYGRGMVFAARQRSSEAMAVGRQLDEMGDAFLHLSARLHLMVGDADGALNRLERAIDAQAIPIFYKDSALWDPIRTHPRFINILQRMRLPTDAAK